MTLPAYHEAEESVLGAILAEPSRLAEIRPLLPDAGAFADPGHAAVYRTICALSDKGQPIDHVTLATALPDQAGALHELLEAGYGGNSEAHARLVAEAWQRRRTIALADRLAARSRDATIPLHETLAALVGEVSKLAGDGPAKKPPTLTQSLMNVVEQIGKPPAHGTTRGLPSGLKGLDTLLDGYGPGIHIIAGNPSEGKSALALAIARRAAEHGPVWINSIEMTQDEIAGRLLQSEIGKSMRWLGEYDARLTEWTPKILEASGRLAQLPVTITEGLLTVSAVRLAWQAECAQGRKPALVVIDYLQLMKPEGRQESRNLDLGGITGALKQWSLKERLPIVLLSQLSRENKRGTVDPLTKERSARKPQLHDLRDSGSIEQDADSVTLIYWPHGEQGPGEQTVNLLVAKNRNGPKGTCYTMFEPWTFRFRDVTP